MSLREWAGLKAPLGGASPSPCVGRSGTRPGLPQLSAGAAWGLSSFSVGRGLDMASVLGRSPEGEAPLAGPSLQGHGLGDRGRAPCSQSRASCLQSGDTMVT